MNSLSEQERAAREQKLTGKGIRLLPYPFGSALAIVSDVDSSSRERYDGYVGMLVDELGLDFGDSTWLRWQYLHERQKPTSNGFGFFSRHFSLGKSEDPSLYGPTRTFNESVAEFHRGNIDHFHSFLSKGPRVVSARNFEIAGDTIEVEYLGFEKGGLWAAQDIFVFGVCVVSHPGAKLSVAEIIVIEADGRETRSYRPASFSAPDDGRDRQLFLLDRPPENEEPVPELLAVRKVRIRFDDARNANDVDRILLTDVNGKLILDRLGYLRDRFNVEVALITEHAGRHFRNPSRGRWNDDQVKEHIEQANGPFGAYNGNLVDDSGDLVFATDSDNPHSFGRVLPELTVDFDCRFFVPMAAGRAFGWSPLELLSPSPTSSGGGFYWARRMLPNIVKPEGRKRFDGTRSKQDTFAVRISRILDYASDEPGLFYPIYTHLGRGSSPEDNRLLEEQTLKAIQGDLALSDKYFEPGPLHALQDRVFNMSGRCEQRDRMWLTRASVLYDYALMLLLIGDQVDRPDANTIEIRSWLDPVLGKTLPVSAAQLYGLTFHVDDPAAARVSLDGAPVELLARNGPDDSGRHSVTIAESEIQLPVFERLDPCRAQPIEPEAGEWTWHPEGERPFGRLTRLEGPQERSKGIASLRIPMNGWAPSGAQALAVSIRNGAKARFGIVLETISGGTFCIGDKSLFARHLPYAMASYLFRQRDRTPEEWTTLVAPFSDLAWADNVAPGGPLPNHALKSITLLCFGPAPSAVDFARLRFLRPRATSRHAARVSGYCLGGSITPPADRQSVHAEPVDTSREPVTVATDQRGYFCFNGLQAGIYRVWSDGEAGHCIDHRGELVDVSTNITTLALAPAPR